MRDLPRLAVLLVALVGLPACVSAPKQHTFEKAMVVQASYDRTWDAVIDVFAEMNWPIQSVAKDSGLITTDWMSVGIGSSVVDCGSTIVPVEDQQVRFNVLVREEAPGHRVTVNTTFRELRTNDGHTVTATCNSTGEVEKQIHQMLGNALVAQQ